MPHLLELPRELRDEIYELVLGTRMVHLISEMLPSSYTIDQEASGSNLGRNEAVYSDDLYCEKCVEINTEEEVYAISQDPDPSDPHSMMMGVFNGGYRYCRRHGQCMSGRCSVPWNGVTKQGPLGTIYRKSSSNLALLRVARIVYHEASAILCAKTIFSLRLAHTLTMLPRNLAPLPQSALRSVHLDINLDADHDTWSWNNEDLRRTLASLPGLRDLRLTIKQSCRGDFRAFLESLREGSLPLWKNDLIHFRRSSLRNVAVVIEDIASCALQVLNKIWRWAPHLHSYHLERENHWTMAERVEYARTLRAKLLAPSPLPPLSA